MEKNKAGGGGWKVAKGESLMEVFEQRTSGSGDTRAGRMVQAREEPEQRPERSVPDVWGTARRPASKPGYSHLGPFGHCRFSFSSV